MTMSVYDMATISRSKLTQVIKMAKAGLVKAELHVDLQLPTDMKETDEEKAARSRKRAGAGKPGGKK